ncbi:unnamed protein product [Caenorhabditis brenneri]
MRVLGILVLLCSPVTGKPAQVAQIREQTLEFIRELDNKWIVAHAMLGVAVPLKSSNFSTGETIKLHCEIGGTPNPILHWTHDGEIIQGDMMINFEEKLFNRGKESTETGITASTLTIPCAQFSDAGKYSCVGFNGHTTIESTAMILVDGNTVGCKPEAETAPIITQWTETRAENIGNTVTLVCRSDKPATWTWTFDEQPIHQGGRYQVMEAGDLIIHNLEFADLGAYYCTATNENGKATAETFLHITRSHS